MMSHKGYVPTVWFEPDDRLFHGMAEGDGHVIHFSGSSVEELEREFREGVEDYVAWCRECGSEPKAPYDPDESDAPNDPRSVVEMAAAADKLPVEKWIDDTLVRAARERLKRTG